MKGVAEAIGHEPRAIERGVHAIGHQRAVDRIGLSVQVLERLAVRPEGCAAVDKAHAPRTELSLESRGHVGAKQLVGTD